MVVLLDGGAVWPCLLDWATRSRKPKVLSKIWDPRAAVPFPQGVKSRWTGQDLQVSFGDFVSQHGTCMKGTWHQEVEREIWPQGSRWTGAKDWRERQRDDRLLCRNLSGRPLRTKASLPSRLPSFHPAPLCPAPLCPTSVDHRRHLRKRARHSLRLMEGTRPPPQQSQCLV